MLTAFKRLGVGRRRFKICVLIVQRYRLGVERWQSKVFARMCRYITTLLRGNLRRDAQFNIYTHFILYPVSNYDD